MCVHEKTAKARSKYSLVTYDSREILPINAKMPIKPVECNLSMINAHIVITGIPCVQNRLKSVFTVWLHTNITTYKSKGDTTYSHTEAGLPLRMSSAKV